METHAVRKDFRSYKRVPVAWSARFCINGQHECDGALRDVSGSGMALNSEAFVRLGDHVVIYADNERFEGHVVRQFEDGFAIALQIRKPKRQRLLAKLMWEVNRDTLADLGEQRSLPRKSGAKVLSSCYLADGTEIYCRIIDMSLVSANVEAHVRPPVGSKVRIGRASGEVIRLTNHGFALIFDQDSLDALGDPADDIEDEASSTDARPAVH